MALENNGFKDMVSELAVPWEEETPPEKRRFYVHDTRGGPGKSGMGIIYLLVDKQDGFPYAVKTFQEKFINTQEAVRRFEREAEVWVELEKHKNIVRAYRVEIYHGRPYVFIQWIVEDKQYGADLSGWIKGGLDISLIVNFAIQVCQGMSHAEKRFKEMGRIFVHRDIKPQNIMVTRDKVIKVTDFGLVHALKDQTIESEVIENEDHRRLTILSQGSIRGTPFYMSPEQILQGQEVLKRLGVLRKSAEIPKLDVTSDIYSFGCVLYEMVKGRPPFFEFPWNVARYFSQTLHEGPEQVNSGHHDMNELIMQCLSKNPSSRGFRNFSEVENVLQEIYVRLSGSRLREEPAEGMMFWELLDRGNSFIHLGKPRRAVEDIGEALELKPNWAEAYNSRAVAFNKLGESRQAIEDCDKALKLKQDYESAFVNRGIAYSKLDQVESALKDISRAIDLNPKHAENYSNRGNVYKKLGQFKLAIEDYGRALALNPLNEEIYFNRATAYSYLNEFESALMDYDRALEINPRLYKGYGNRGILYRKLGQLERAIEDFDTALRFNPENAQDYTNRGNAYRDLGKLEQALENYDRSLEINLTSIAFGARAVVYTKLGKFERALENFDKALKIDSDVPEIYYHQGIAYYKFGQLEKAVQSLTRFIDLALPHHTQLVAGAKEFVHRIESAVLEKTSKYVSVPGSLEDADAANKKGDYKTARQILLKETNEGNTEAQYKLGFMYDNGHGVHQDLGKAFKYYSLAAAQGYALAQNNLGAMYKYGDGVNQNYNEAMKWFKLAAAQGQADAQNNLGCMYRDGQGTSQNDEEAVQWLKLAAQQGNARAQGNLGLMYAQGRGVSQNYEEAYKYFMLAANQGLAEAQYSLGVLYFNGNGVEQDMGAALKWIKISAANGDDMAKQALSQLQ